MNWILPSLLAGIFLMGAESGLAAEYGLSAHVPIDRFYEVSPGIYRGARPESGGMQALAKLGIKTDLNLEDDRAVIKAEMAQARKLGMRFVSKPMSGFNTPSDRTVNAALALLADSDNYPIFIHCHYGEDRTGLLVGLYRVIHEGWKPATAYREMKKNGFKSFRGLQQYFEDRTGYNGFFLSLD